MCLCLKHTDCTAIIVNFLLQRVISRLCDVTTNEQKGSARYSCPDRAVVLRLDLATNDP